MVGPPACLRCDVGKCGRGGLIIRVWVGEQTNGCMGVRVDVCRGGCMGGCLDVWVGGWEGGCVGVRVNGWMMVLRGSSRWEPVVSCVGDAVWAVGCGRCAVCDCASL